VTCFTCSTDVPVVERNPLPRVALETREALHDWLEANHATHRGIWLVQWRPGTGRPAIAYDDIVEECLLFGWIDSTVQSFDDQLGGVRLTPRKPTSWWSAVNKKRLEKLQGQLRPAGIAAVEVAKANGSFYFLDDVEALIVPDDLATELGDARDVFDGFSAGRRKQALQWLKAAKWPATRAQRIAKIAAAAREGQSVF
jgi:uncharacterized protein YdeI (YjbR/CyaY-like superfamily)